MIKKENNRIKDVISDSIEKLSSIIDVNTVIGAPVNIDDGVIIPVAKVTFCILSGGGEYGKINVFKSSEELPFTAGHGSIISIKPSGFLLKNKGSDYKILSVSNNNLDGIIDKTTDFIKSMTKDAVDNKGDDNED